MFSIFKGLLLDCVTVVSESSLADVEQCYASDTLLAVAFFISLQWFVLICITVRSLSSSSIFGQGRLHRSSEEKARVALTKTQPCSWQRGRFKVFKTSYTAWSLNVEVAPDHHRTHEMCHLAPGNFVLYTKYSRIGSTGPDRFPPVASPPVGWIASAHQKEKVLGD